MTLLLRIGAWASLALALPSTLFITACCAGGEDYFNVIHGGTTPSWGEHSSYASDQFTASWVLGKATGGEPLEFYRDETRIEVPSEAFDRDNSTENGCGHSRVVNYDLSMLDPGVITVVHRRSSGTGDPVNCLECPWETFNGEEALVTTIDL